MSKFSFSAPQRLQIISILPQESGSLRESIQVKRLRDRVSFSEDERELIDMDPETGSFDPDKFDKLDDKELDLGEAEREILAGCFIKREDEGEVPTNDAFVELAMELSEEIQAFRDQLDETTE